LGRAVAAGVAAGGVTGVGEASIAGRGPRCVQCVVSRMMAVAIKVAIKQIVFFMVLSPSLKFL
jgi:hypothetical protein